MVVLPALSARYGAAVLETEIALAGPAPATAATPAPATGTGTALLVRLLVAGWLLGVALVGGVHVMAWRRVERLRRHGAVPAPAAWRARLTRLQTALGLERAVELVASKAVEVPTVIGWLRPLILVPASAFAGLAPSQLEAILVHELAHVRRHDYLVNLLQAVVETLLFFHPAVWWVSRQVRQTREHCCDDLAVATCGDRLRYARALAAMEGLRPPAPAFALGADGGSLLARIERLLGAAAGRPSGDGWLAAAVAATVLSAGVLLGAGLGVASSDAQETERAVAEAVEGRWWAEPRRGGVQLEMTFRHQRGRTQVSSSLEAGAFADAAAGAVLRRAAGAFHFDGDPRRGGRGTVVFRGDADHLAALRADDIDTTPDQLFQLALHQVDALAFGRALRELGYRDLTVERLIELTIHDVDPEYLRDLAGHGLTRLALDKAVELSIHDVDPRFIAALADLGFTDLDADQLIELSIHDVDPDYVRSLAEHGYTPTVKELIELSIHDVDPAFVGGIREQGYTPTVKELIELSIHDVDPAFIGGIREHGYTPTVKELIELSIHDVDPDLVSALRTAGYQVGRVGEVVELSIHGIGPELLRDLAELGYQHLAAEQLVELAIHDVTPSFIRRLRDRGIRDLSVDELVRLRIAGFDR